MPDMTTRRQNIIDAIDNALSQSAYTGVIDHAPALQRVLIDIRLRSEVGKVKYLQISFECTEGRDGQ